MASIYPSNNPYLTLAVKDPGEWVQQETTSASSVEDAAIGKMSADQEEEMTEEV